MIGPEFDTTTLQNASEVVFHVLKHHVEGPSVRPRLRVIRHDTGEMHDGGMGQLAKNLDLPHGRDGEPFLLVIHSHLMMVKEDTWWQ